MNPTRQKNLFRSCLGILFVLLGILHFTNLSFYVEIMPKFLPCPVALVYLSGIFEILGGIGVLLPATRSWAGCGLIVLLLAVFPANVQMLLNHLHSEGFSLTTFFLILRLPLQFGFIAIVHWLTKKNSLN